MPFLVRGYKTGFMLSATTTKPALATSAKTQVANSTGVDRVVAAHLPRRHFPWRGASLAQWFVSRAGR
ncbi:hypothetical protein A5N17_09670 [Arthrobacter sp. D2]|nr:hypothetical protein [Arthrobacter sp. M5]NKR14794.1 hypothetical protein [Arthrobacter sp. M6]OEH62349.1 hypothetical protein A5N13_01430 [Arthrobacter sp. D4]OEH62920.1 hypothetical protein A5N17_09670 [Arthrobacter sp. D2]